MNLLLPFDHRFFRAQDGGIFSDKAYQHSFFQSRYLQVFEHVYVLARVQDVPCAKALTEPVEGPGVTLLALPDWNGSLGFLRHRARIVAAASEALRRPSAVIMIGPGGIGSLLFNGLRKRGRPIGLEIVGDPWDAFQPGAIRHPLRPVLRWHLTRSLRKYCASAAAASYVTNRFLQERYPCPSFSIGVSDVVLPDSVFVGTPRRYAPATCRTAICVAVLNGYKGHDVLIDALANSRGMGIELRLVLVGDGPLQGEIQCRVEQKGLCESVRFAGQLPSGAAVREELDRADLFVMASRQEGTPRAMLEAMARGLPCVASNVGGIPELLEADALVPSNDPVALANKLREVLSDPERMNRMSVRNLEVAQTYRSDLLQTRRIEFYTYLRDRTEDWLRKSSRCR